MTSRRAARHHGGMTDLSPTPSTRRRDDLVALTAGLIRIPTVNPPGDHYREICEYLAAPAAGRASPRSS